MKCPGQHEDWMRVRTDVIGYQLAGCSGWVFWKTYLVSQGPMKLTRSK